MQRTCQYSPRISCGQDRYFRPFRRTTTLRFTHVCLAFFIVCLYLRVCKKVPRAAHSVLVTPRNLDDPRDELHMLKPRGNIIYVWSVRTNGISERLGAACVGASTQRTAVGRARPPPRNYMTVGILCIILVCCNTYTAILITATAIKPANGEHERRDEWLTCAPHFRKSIICFFGSSDACCSYNNLLFPPPHVHHTLTRVLL